MVMIASWLVGRRISQGETMLYSGSDAESCITEYTLVYEDKATVETGGDPLAPRLTYKKASHFV